MNSKQKYELDHFICEFQPANKKQTNDFDIAREKNIWNKSHKNRLNVIQLFPLTSNECVSTRDIVFFIYE